ncbi:gibberellin 2-beta-dioxygenase 2-like [Cucurbita pepo subsp. pepo]|uniref:gibberellin 2-beta-dioxygenase 2-like n=1 Tax=Cucurbita pepo subsp. pepo TaxID=3664 RepID=UPI000C9D69CC|nr:gibberellin 2-beta-dioxygenase 2-like [Cucurbita pepo subsp. pepo]
MVVASPNSSLTTSSKPSAADTATTAAAARIPTIDLSGGTSNRQALSKLLVEASEKYGIFKLINHGIPQDRISRAEEEAMAFFAKPTAQKLAASPKSSLVDTGNTTRFGYGINNIGHHGDIGEIEYLLLSSQPSLISQLAFSISQNPSKFSCALNDYIQATKNVACELLDLMAEGLGISDNSIFSRMILDSQSDSLLRINHYRPLPDFIHPSPSNKLGFGEHSDPQIFAILRSNDIAGLQILLDDGLWVPVPPDPTAYYVMIGDLFQVFTNGRFGSLKHRATANIGPRSRMSMTLFASPSLDTWISPLPEMVTSDQPCIYRPFTWREYKTYIYSLTLAGSRLDSFKIRP